MVDFSSILSKPATEVEKPPLKPAGTYLHSVVGVPELKGVMVKGEEKPVVSFKLKLLVPQSDVDQDALSDPKLGDPSAWPPFTYDIWVDGPQGEYNLKRTLVEVYKIDPGTEKNSKTLGEMLAEVPGKQAMCQLQIEPYTDRDGQPQMSNRVRSLAAA